MKICPNCNHNQDNHKHYWDLKTKRKSMIKTCPDNDKEEPTQSNGWRMIWAYCIECQNPFTLKEYLKKALL